MAKQQTPVHIIARYQLKTDSSQVFYKVRSCTDASKEYCVTYLDGVAVECDCPARKPCKHMRHCTHLEASRNHTEQADDMPAQPLVETETQQDAHQTAGSTQTSDTLAIPLQGDVTPIVARKNVSTAELSLSHSFLMRGQRTGGMLANAS